MGRPNTSAPADSICGWMGRHTSSCHRPCCTTGLYGPPRSPALPLRSSPVCCKLRLWGGQAERSGAGSSLQPPHSPSPVSPGYLVGQRQGRQEWEARASLSAHACTCSRSLTPGYPPGQVPFRMAAEPSPPHPWVPPLSPFSPTACPNSLGSNSLLPILQVAPVTEVDGHWQGSARWLSHRSTAVLSSLLSSAHFWKKKGKKIYTLGSEAAFLFLSSPCEGMGFRAQDITLKPQAQGGWATVVAPDCAIRGS